MSDELKRLSVSGKIEEVIYTRLMPGDDLLHAIWEVIEEYDIKTGVILEGSGALTEFRCQHFPDNPKTTKFPIDIITMDGPLEASIKGTIGTLQIDDDVDPNLPSLPGNYPTIPGELETIEDKWSMAGSPNGKNGAPYVHAHVTCTNNSRTITGHLMPGSTIESLMQGSTTPSHFTLVIAKVSGVKLINKYDKNGYYHDIVKV